MSDAQQRTIESYHRLMNANAMSQAFLLARKLGVFDRLMEGQKTAISLAEELDLKVRPLELLLDQLCETGYIERYGDDYALSVLGKMLPPEWTDLGNRYWREMEKWIRDGERLEPADAPADQTEFAIEKQAMEWMSTPNALELIQILNIGQSRQGMRLVELDCGSAVFSSALGYHDPTLKIILVDSADNLERARRTTDSVEISSRCQFVEADPRVFDSTFEADMILLANGLWRYDDSELTSLLSNAAKRLNQRGEIVVIDEFCEMNDQRFANRNHGLLTEMRTPKGKHRSKKEVTECLYECGFVEAMYSDLKSAPGTKGVLVAGVSPA